MRIAELHLESLGGMAGDMLLAALLDLGADEVLVQQAFSGLALQLRTTVVQVNGERALHVQSIAPQPEHHHTHLEHISEVRLSQRGEARRLAPAKDSLDDKGFVTVLLVPALSFRLCTVKLSDHDARGVNVQGANDHRAYGLHGHVWLN